MNKKNPPSSFLFVGLDFMVRDISKSWKEQNSAVLELNTAPCIDFHQYANYGQPKNIAAEVFKMVIKYYF